MTNFKPSQVVLLRPPLADTMRHAEAEAAAAMIVRTLAVKGDTWRAVTWDEIEDVIATDMTGTVNPLTMVRTPIEPLGSLMRNPFFRPDVHDTIRRGFARWTGDPGGPVEFTDAGIQALSKYVRKEN